MGTDKRQAVVEAQRPCLLLPQGVSEGREGGPNSSDSFVDEVMPFDEETLVWHTG